MLGTRISHTAHCFKIVQQAATWKTSHAQKQTTQNTNQLLRQRRLNYKVQTEPHFSHFTLFWQYFRDLLVEKNSKPKHTYTKRNQMFKRYRKASQSPIPSWVTNQQVLIIFFCAFRNKGEGAPAISDLVQRENNGTGYWIVNMSDSHFGRPQYVIYCSQLWATPSADCNISHIAVGLSNYLIHSGNLSNIAVFSSFLTKFLFLCFRIANFALVVFNFTTLWQISEKSVNLMQILTF